MALPSATSMFIFEEMGNLVLIGSKVNQNLLINWLSEKCTGSFSVIRNTIALYSGAKQPTIGPFTMPASRIEYNSTSGLAILFEKAEDIVRLKISFDWTDTPVEFTK